MQDNYYKVSGSPYRDAPFSKKPQKPWIVYTIVAVAVVILLSIVLLVARNNRVVDSEIISLQEACDNGGCSAADVGDLSRISGDYKECSRLEGEKLYACAVQYGIQKQDENACSVLKGEDKNRCSNLVLNALADDTKDPIYCEGISDGESKVACIKNVLQSFAYKLSCSRVKAAYSDSCYELQSDYERYVVADSVDFCDQFKVQFEDEEDLITNVDESQVCLDFQSNYDGDRDRLSLYRELEIGTSDSSADTDADGLNDFDEVNVHGTDPVNLDTDGDGFSDGTEVQGGFDPLSAPEVDE